MLAVMYGVMPRAKMENFLKAPPENRSTTLRRSPALPRFLARASAFTPGTETCTPSR